MDLLILLLSTLPVIFLIILCKNGENSFRKSPYPPPPPGPPGIPVLGNLHQFDQSAPHKYLWKLSKKYGPLMSLKLGSLPVLVVSSARMAAEVLKNHDLIFCSRPPMVGQQKLSYNGLDIALAPYNEEWREMRKIGVVHLLNAKRVLSFRPIREDEVSRMIRKISSEDATGVININETILSFTSTMICRMAFGKRYDEEDHERRRFNDLLHDAQAVVVGFYFSNFFPKIGWLDYLTGTFSRLGRTFQKLDLFYQELIDEHMDPNRPSSMDGDIIDLLLQLINQNNSTSLDLNLNHVKALLMNIFVAGSDTSAATIIWAMTALIKSPTKMKKAQAEIRELIGSQKMIDEDDVDKFSYLKAVVKETLRLYPPAPLLVPRFAMENCIIDGYEIRRNTIVHVNAWAIARDPDFWENPEEFLPERFLHGDLNAKALQDQFHFIPFGAGRRSCPGYSLALRTVELALANLLLSFDWELPPGVKEEDIDSDVLPGISMLKKNDLHLVAKKLTT